MLLNYSAEIHVQYTQQRIRELRRADWEFELASTRPTERSAGLRFRLGTALIALGDAIAGPRPVSVVPSVTAGGGPGQLQLR